jgi:hypothetical protein
MLTPVGLGRCFRAVMLACMFWLEGSLSLGDVGRLVVLAQLGLTQQAPLTL